MKKPTLESLKKSGADLVILQAIVDNLNQMLNLDQVAVEGLLTTRIRVNKALDKTKKVKAICDLTPALSTLGLLNSCVLCFSDRYLLIGNYGKNDCLDYFGIWDKIENCVVL